jgi:opacity protein-like surface antigen
MSKILTAVAVGAVAVATMATVANSQQPIIEAPAISATSTSQSEDYSYSKMLETMSSIDNTRKPHWAE